MTVDHSLPTNLAGWLQYIEALHPKSISMGLERVAKVKQQLGLAPAFPLIIVGGTNGKGSTCAMLERIYHEAGYAVAAYSSPHLLRYNERVRINTIEVNDQMLIEAFSAVEGARGGIALTYFEFGTLAAMWCFMQHKLDVAVLEVGLGGRLDAVNIFDPDCTIVTTIDIDHTEFLGDNRESIGYEKAGIFRPGIPAICGDRQPPHSLITHAEKIGAPLMLIGREFKPVIHEKSWAQTSADLSEALPFPALSGEFQIDNASAAMAAVAVMRDRLPVTTSQAAAGLTSVTLAGRFQKLASAPDIILDVTHNPHAAHALAENLRRSVFSGRTLAVFSMLADKDVSGVVEAVTADIQGWYIAPIQHNRSTSAEKLKDTLKQCGISQITVSETLADAYKQACLAASKNDRIIVFGSFFTVAEVMSVLSGNADSNMPCPSVP